jgi:hypothetical protein
MRTGLLASTWTPGRTAPEASFTTPVILLCARAATGSRRSPNDETITNLASRVRIIETSSFFRGYGKLPLFLVRWWQRDTIVRILGKYRGASQANGLRRASGPGIAISL